jgi:hypothetical protein
MHLPRAVYEALPFAYVAGGVALCAGSYGAQAAPWTEVAFALGAAGILVGLVLVFRRRTYRDEAARYDAHSLDDVRPDERR